LNKNRNSFCKKDKTSGNFKTSEVFEKKSNQTKREKMNHRTWLYGLLVIASTLIFAQTVFAQQPTPPRVPSDDEVNAVAKQLYCPVCENTPLDVCPTQACAEWRALIRDKLAQGWNAEQIKTYFAQQYGDRVLATPPAHGLNWLVYIIPPLMFLAGVFLLYRAFKAWQKPSPQAAQASTSSPQTETEDEYIKKLEEELRKHQEV
jgi:cytochrome c-type biogenesis protein CcmH